MADPEHLARLMAGVEAWNSWRDKNWNTIADLTDANLAGFDLNRVTFGPSKLNGAILSEASLSNASFERSSLHHADMRGAILARANLREANLTQARLDGADMRDADLSHANLSEAHLSGANLTSADLFEAFLSRADLSRTWLVEANLRRADLRSAVLEHVDGANADLSHAYLQEANLRKIHLAHAKLDSAKLIKANLSGADLNEAHLDRAELTDADLTDASLYRASLVLADLSRTNLTNVDLRAATLFRTKLHHSIMTGASMWESQRSGWLIKNVACERASWDRKAREWVSYTPGEFERLYSEQSCIELLYQSGVTKFELNTLPALLHHLATLHPEANIRLKSIEEIGGGAKISISVGDADPETIEKIRADATQVHKAQLALRDNEILRLETEKKYLESFVSERLIKAMLTATTQQNVFNAPVYGVALSSGNSSAVVNQTVNDNAALLALLEKMIQRRDELDLGGAEARSFQAEVESARTELEKPEPAPSILSRSLKFVQKIAGEAATKAAGKLGEQVVSADWHAMLHQLNAFIQSIK